MVGTTIRCRHSAWSTHQPQQQTRHSQNSTNWSGWHMRTLKTNCISATYKVSCLSLLQMQHGRNDVSCKVGVDTGAHPRKLHSCLDSRHSAIRSGGTATFLPTSRLALGKCRDTGCHPSSIIYGVLASLWYEIHVGVVNLQARLTSKWPEHQERCLLMREAPLRRTPSSETSRQETKSFVETQEANQTEKTGMALEHHD